MLRRVIHRINDLRGCPFVIIPRRRYERLMNLRRNLTSGAIVNVSRELVRLLMEKDWRNG